MRGTVLVAVCVFSLSGPVSGTQVVAQGVHNFHQVNERIYRGGQPTDEGWKSLAKLGVKTVIDLRPDSEHSGQAEKRAVEAAGMRYVNVPLSGVGAPPDAKISKVLALLADASGSVFVHCRRGSDRTGTAIACYRITHDGWTNRRALKEAVSYGMSWMEFGMQRFVMAYHPVGAPPPPPAAPAAPPPVPPGSTAAAPAN